MRQATTILKSSLLMLCCAAALQLRAQKSQALHIDEILQREPVADTFHLGLTCTYKLVDSKQDAFAFAVRDNSALVRINGRDCWLRYTSSKNGADGGATFTLRYGNALYNVELHLRRMKDDTGNKGTMTVTDVKSKRRVSVAVAGGCEA